MSKRRAVRNYRRWERYRFPYHQDCAGLVCKVLTGNRGMIKAADRMMNCFGFVEAPRPE